MRQQNRPGLLFLDPIRDAAAVQGLRLPEAGEIAPYVMDTIRLLRRALNVPLLTLAADGRRHRHLADLAATGLL